MKAIEQDEFRRLFLAAFYLKIPLLKKKIKKVVYKKLGLFDEVGNIDDIVDNCISDIESILIKQLNAKPDELFNYKERKRKLELFHKDKNYVQRYLLEAAKSFCRKKQHFWTHGRNKANTQKGEKHKSIKVGRAARVHYSGERNDIENWMDTLISSNFSPDMLTADVFNNLNIFFRTIGMNENKIKCFWDRFEGLTFVEMAEQDLTSSATPDKHRKRFKRIILQLEPYSNDFKEILLGRYN